MAFFSVHWCRRACPRNSRQFWATRSSQESGKNCFSGNSLRDLRHPSLWTFSIYRHGKAAVSPDFASVSRFFLFSRIAVAIRDPESRKHRRPTRDHPGWFNFALPRSFLARVTDESRKWSLGRSPASENAFPGVIYPRSDADSLQRQPAMAQPPAAFLTKSTNSVR